MVSPSTPSIYLVFDTPIRRVAPPVACRAQGPDTPPYSRLPGARRIGRARCAAQAYSAALATRAFSASSNASMRRAVAIGDFVNFASML